MQLNKTIKAAVVVLADKLARVPILGVLLGALAGTITDIAAERERSSQDTRNG